MTQGAPGAAGFAHAAFLYADDDEYLAGTVPFIEGALNGGEPVLVAVPSVRLELLRSRLAPVDPERCRFEPMEAMGRNPARIIPAWRDFVARHSAAGRALRGIGEPIWRGRSPAELAECQRHEALLNLAFADADAFTLLCPYDSAALAPDVLDEARHSHPWLWSEGAAARSEAYRAEVPAWSERPLTPPPPDAARDAFGAAELSAIRHRTAALAAAAGLSTARAADLVLAVSEAITNSVCHGGGAGEIRWWTEGGSFLCEIRDPGRIADPLAGREHPGVDSPTGRGLWIINQLCDLVQVRVVAHGQVLRLHMSRHER